MLDHMENEENYMRNPGYVDEIKFIDNVRILKLNPRVCQQVNQKHTCW